MVPADPVAPTVAVPYPQRKPGVVETIELLNPIDTGLVYPGTPLQATSLQRYCVATVGIVE